LSKNDLIDTSTFLENVATQKRNELLSADVSSSVNKEDLRKKYNY